MERYADYRQAAKDGIIAAGGKPVMMEDFPSLSSTPRNACLDLVASCDICLILVGERGGSITPSGKTVVEEEYEEALRKKLRILVFIQDINRDETAAGFVEGLSDYVNGYYRVSFGDPAELKEAVKTAVSPLIGHDNNPITDSTVIDQLLVEPHIIRDEASLRFLLVPERIENMIDPFLIDEETFLHSILEIGHSKGVALFSFNRRKDGPKIGAAEVVYLQIDEGDRRSGRDEVRLELGANGRVVVDLNVTGTPDRSSDDFHFGSLEIVRKDVENALQRCFTFADEYYDFKDPYRRFNRFFFNCALNNIGSRRLVDQPTVGDSVSVGLQQKHTVIALENPRLVSRDDIKSPSSLIQGSVKLLGRHLEQ
jgi:hypothetical protein